MSTNEQRFASFENLGHKLSGDDKVVEVDVENNCVCTLDIDGMVVMKCGFCEDQAYMKYLYDNERGCIDGKCGSEQCEICNPMES